MATLTELHIYPIKSCAGMAVAQATLTRAGLEAGGVADREWMVVDPDGRFLSQREQPRLALVVPRLAGAVLALSAPGMASLELPLAQPQAARARAVRVWDDRVLASDCGDAAAGWFAQVLGTACRLVRFHPDAVRLGSGAWTGGVGAPTRFADGYPVLVIGAASLADLNGRLVAAGRPALPMNRFRPNLVIDGIGAFEEDYVEQFEIGQARVKPVKPCARCPIPSVDQASGVPGADPLDILQAYRRKPQLDGAVCFGMNCIVSAGAGERLVVGQELVATLAF